MAAQGIPEMLPDPQNPKLGLKLPTDEELEEVHRLSFFEWGDSLTMGECLEECDYLTKVPLARNGGMVSWILCDERPQNKRLILASCETFQKRTYVNDAQGHFSEAVIHGIASVFVSPKYRHRGYAGRLMHELNKQIPKWYIGSTPCLGSILYSDIGPIYYTKFGWPAFPVNSHLEFDPALSKGSLIAQQIRTTDLAALCEADETMSRKAMAAFPSGKIQFMIGQIEEHTMWHVSKEIFACQKIFGSVPNAKGAVAGDVGSRIWVLWTHRYYSHPRTNSEDNVLYILRTVVENQNPSPEQAELQITCLKAVIEAAQDEAAKWRLRYVKLWHPTPRIQDMVMRSGLEYRHVERDKDGIACLNWCGPVNNPGNLEWVASEHYAWL